MEGLTQKEEILEQIKFMKKTSPEELYRIVLSSIELFIKSVFIFGINSNEAKESINVIKEMRRIIKEERILLNGIEKKIDSIDLDQTVDVIDELDSLNDKTFLLYDDILNEIDISCDTRQKGRTLKSRQGIDSLITNPTYKERVIKLIRG